MTDNYEYWSGKLASSQADFSASAEAKEAKERMFNMVMQQVAQPGQSVPTYQQSGQMVDTIAGAGSTTQRPKRVKTAPKEKVKKTDRSKTTNKSNTLRFASVFVAVTVFGFVIYNLNTTTKPAIMTMNYYNPPLVAEDIPVAVTNSGKDLRTIAADNNFYLAYESNKEIRDQITLLLHSRNSKINWKQLFITDDNNNIITPLYVDEKNSYITLPVSESDLQLEISDEAGNVFKCTLPKNL